MRVCLILYIYIYFLLYKLCIFNVLLGGAKSIGRLRSTQFTCFSDLSISRRYWLQLELFQEMWEQDSITSQLFDSDASATFRGHPAVKLDHHRPVFNDRLSASINCRFHSHLCTANCSPWTGVIFVSRHQKATVFSIRQDQALYKCLISMWSLQGREPGPHTASHHVRDLYIYVLDLNSCNWLTSI